jgi:uncharacterized protein involved in exopolysaccharide biosynthesis
LFAALIGALAGALVATRLPPSFRASARLFVVPGDDPTAMRATNALDLATATLPMVVAVLKSERVADSVVTHLALDQKWHLSRRQAAQRVLHELEVEPERKTNLVAVSYEDGTAAGARAVVAAVVEAAGATADELWSARNRLQQERLEQELAAARQKVEEGIGAIERFRTRTHVVDLDAQIKESVAQAAALERLRIDKSLTLQFARGYGDATSIEVQRSVREERAVARELEAMRHDMSRPGPLLALDSLPALEAEQARLKRELDTATARFEALLQKVELLRATDARPGGRAETIDPAVEPLRRAGPSPIRYGVGTALAFAFVVALAVLFIDSRRRRRPLTAY